MEPRVHPVASTDGTTLTVEEYGAAGGAATVVFLPALGVPVAYYRPLFRAPPARYARTRSSRSARARVPRTPAAAGWPGPSAPPGSGSSAR